MHPDRDILACPCGKSTSRSLANLDAAGGVVSCWVALDRRGFAYPGCAPSEWTESLIARRNARLVENQRPLREPPVRLSGDLVISCACGARTRVITSSASDLNVVEGAEAGAIVSRTCWLSIAAEGGPQAGCDPDHRTWEVLGRARGTRRPGTSAHVETVRSITSLPVMRAEAAKTVLIETAPVQPAQEKIIDASVPVKATAPQPVVNSFVRSALTQHRAA